MPPTAGDLLRVMRLWKGWSQEQAAAQVGVVRTAIAHGERSERLPSTEQMQTLCCAPGAQEVGTRPRSGQRRGPGPEGENGTKPASAGQERRPRRRAL
jgi:DNA-binding XRE family transcriptional regulator